MSLVNKVIINADDFGKDENATMAIAESFRRGFINQTTLMVNMPWAEKAVEIARKEGFADKVGLHLNLTEGETLTTAIAKCESICNAEGVFRGRIPDKNDLCDSIVKKAVVNEIAKQIERYVSFGLPRMHCDGHHHVQTRMHIAKLLMPVLKRYDFRTIRRPANIYHSKGLHIRSRVHQALFARLSRKNGLVLTDYFSGWINGLERVAARATLEVMVHPRYDRDGCLVDVTDFDNDKGQPMCEINKLINCGMK